jgi:hypothetical protein
MVERDIRWKWLLLGLCTLALVILFSQILDFSGFGGRPWFGFWDDTYASTTQPYVVAVYQPRAGGASDLAGLRDGDRVDLREQSLDARVAVMWQLMGTRSTQIVVHRNATTFTRGVVGSGVFGSASQWKAPNFVIRGLAYLWLLGSAFLIAIRRWWSFEGRMLASFLVCESLAQIIRPLGFVLPNPYATLLMYVFSNAFALVASLLLIGLCSRYGARSARRRIVEWFAYTTNALVFVVACVGATAILTMWADPNPFVNGALESVLGAIGGIFVAIAATVAVTSTSTQARARTAWLLLPLPVALLAGFVIGNISALIHSWYLLLIAYMGASLVVLLGAFLVTYALFSRRVFDAGFLISRTIVVSTVSLIVVMAFVLLEWGLGTLLTGASHAEGLVANAALALALGVSMRFIHRRVDGFVDAVMFRKRHEDERALRDFSKEAAFVTERDALLDRALENVRAHTDARAIVILLAENGTYRAFRHFGEIATEVDVNDPAILALKARRAPIDPHRYATALNGDLALPMVARGQLLGVILCGERASGEAYAPDDVDALSEFAHGVGSAIDGLRGGSGTEGIAGLRDSIAALRDIIEQRLPERG